MALTDNLRANWNLNETSGTRASSVNSYTLSDQNTVGYNTGKISNGAETVKNNTEGLYIDSNLGITDASKSYTSAFWIRATSEPATNVSYCIHRTKVAGTAGTETQCFYTDVSGTKKLQFQRYSDVSAVLSYDITLGTTNFYFITITYDGTNFKAFVNAVERASGASGTTGYNVTGTSRFTMGIGVDLSSQPSNCVFDEYSFWDRVLSQAEIESLYNSGNGLAYPFTASTSIKSINGLAIASVKSINGLAIASVKSWDGLSNVS